MIDAIISLKPRLEIGNACLKRGHFSGQITQRFDHQRKGLLRFGAERANRLLRRLEAGGCRRVNVITHGEYPLTARIAAIVDQTLAAVDYAQPVRIAA